MMRAAVLRCRLPWALLFLAVTTAHLPATAHAQTQGRLLGELIEHLATHSSYEIAKAIVDRVLNGDKKMPDLSVSDEALKKLAFDQLKACIERAQWLDDHNPDRPYDARDKSHLNDPFYAHDLELYHSQCDHIVQR
jgi:hypothetical protein